MPTSITLFRLLERELDDATTEKRCTYTLYLLRETLWPGGVLNTEPTVPPSDRQKEVTRQQAERCLKQFLPGECNDANPCVLV